MIYIIVVLTILLILVVDCNTTSNTGYNTINDPNIVLDFPPLTLILTDNVNIIDNNINHNTINIDTSKQNISDTNTNNVNNINNINNTNNVNNNINTAADKDGIIRGEIWGLSTMKGIMRGQNLKITRLHVPNVIGSCFEVECQGLHCPYYEKNESLVDHTKIHVNIKQFCYPAIIVTGLPKCGTSAMFDLLARFPNAARAVDKENCPFARRRSHWQFFNSIPSVKDVIAKGPNGMVVDGCIDMTRNIMIRNYLRKPDTVYIVLTRNYADMVWSSYNFWCKRDYDGFDCDYSHWVNPLTHKRSPELFHDMIQGDSNGTAVPNPMYKTLEAPCRNAGGYYSEFLENQLWPNIPKNQTLVFASEELEKNPRSIWTRVAQVFGIVLSEKDEQTLETFTKYRYNTQRDDSLSVDRGPHQQIPIEKYQPGLFNVSGYKPMLPSTRTLLDKCWKYDCIKINQYANYNYSCYKANK